MHFDTKKIVYLPPMKTEWPLDPTLFPGPCWSVFRMWFSEKSRTTRRTTLCRYGTCGASIAPAASVEPKITPSQPGEKNLMWKRAKKHERKLEPMSLLPPPALMSWVTCRRNYYLVPRAAYAVPRTPTGQGGGHLSTGEALGLAATSHPPSQLAGRCQLRPAAYLPHTVHSPPE